LANARGRREDDERWTRETRERARERRGGARWERVEMRAMDGSSRDARARGATSRARMPPRVDEGVGRGRRNSRRETRAWMWAIVLAAIARMPTMANAGPGLAIGAAAVQQAATASGGGRIDARGAGALRGREHRSGCESVVDRGGGAATLSIAQQVCEN
jgi:hypothetical protein